MLKDEMWKIFEATGKIDAYLYCKLDSENKQDDEIPNLTNDIEENTLE